MKKRLCALLSVFAVVMSLCACQKKPAEDTGETEDSIRVIMPRGEYAETPVVDYSLTNLPEFVADISQCTDPEKQYVLPDGHLYEYGTAFVPSAVNRLLQATDDSGALFNGSGYQDNARIRGVLEIGESDCSFVTGFIPVKAGDTVYFGGNCLMTQFEKAQNLHIALYDTKKNVIGQTSMKETADTFFEVLESNEAGYVTAMRINEWRVPYGLTYIRFTLLGSGAQQIISVNEPLNVGAEAQCWVKGEKYVPASWFEEIAETVETINRIALAEPDSAIRFVFATDIHVDPDPSGSYTGNLGKVSAEVMRACGIPFFATGGDNCTQSSGFMPGDFAQNMKVVLEQLEPIPQKNILLSVGNHDGATGSREINGETIHYCYQLNNAERSAVFFDWQRESNEYKQFDSDGTYYYLDDPATKTRYIVLNSFWSEWEGEEDGFVSDIQHGFMQTPLFGSRQLTWFADKALDMPPEYAAVIITHFAPAAKDFEVFKGIVDAFSSRSAYRGSYVGAEDWQSTDIAVNYRYANGEIVAVFQGHNHDDAVHDFFQNIPCINTTTAGAYWAVRGENTVERVPGTETEFAADVVVIDREKRMIHITRLGAGEDRTIPY